MAIQNDDKAGKYSQKKFFTERSSAVFVRIPI